MDILFKKVSPVLLFLAGLVGGGEGWAAVRLPKLVGDRMVLQRETELKIWGWAEMLLTKMRASASSLPAASSSS